MLDLQLDTPLSISKFCQYKNTSKCDDTYRCDSLEYHLSLSNHTKNVDISTMEASPVSVTSLLCNLESTNTDLMIPYCDSDSDADDWNEIPTKQHKQQRKSIKKVRFLLDEDGNIDEGISLYSIPTYEITPKLKSECWYSKDDRLRNKAAMQKYCREYEISLKDYRQYQRAMVSVLAYLAHCDSDDHETILNIPPEIMESVSIIVNDDTRGMERSMQFCMALPRISTKSNVQAVLRTQALISELNSANYEEHEVEELIANQCIIHSHLGVRWAKLLGQGDAVKALQYHESEYSQKHI